MPKREDGGPAFPCPSGCANLTGMSLRDWFASQVAVECLRFSGTDQEEHSRAASYAYRMADAMLKAREVA